MTNNEKAAPAQTGAASCIDTEYPTQYFPRAQARRAGRAESTDLETALHCIAGIDPRGLPYDEWLAVGMALKAGGASVADWEQWSRGDSARFNEGECARKWAGFKSGGVGVGTLVKMFRDAGGTYPPPFGKDEAFGWNDFIGGPAAPPVELPPVSFYPLCTDKIGKPAPLGELLAGVKSGKWAELVARVRAAVAAEMPKKQLQTLKAEILPAFAGAGVFSYCNKVGLSKAAGLILLDVDKLPDTAAAERVRDALAAHPSTVAAFISPGGLGCKAIARIDAPVDDPEHKQAFAALEVYWKGRGITLDPSGDDICRLSYVSHDAGAFIRRTPAAVFRWRKLTIESIADFLATPPPPLDCIVEELFEAGEKGEIIAPSKARKSFFAIDLAAHIAAGRDFLCFKIPRPRRVLLFNLEIGRDWMKRRFYRRLAYYGIRPDDIRDTLHIVNARGKGQVVREQAVEAVRRARAEVAFVDPRYKLLMPTESENAGEGVAGVLDLQDQMAEAGAAAIFVGHDGKGTAGDRDDRDRGAGSGWTGRDCDFRIVLSPHADDPQDAVVLSIMRRNFPPFEPVTLRHEGDGIQLDMGTAPRKETTFTRRQTAKAAAPLDSFRPVVREVLRQEGEPLPSGVLVAKVQEACRIGEKRAVTLIQMMEGDGELAATPRQSKRGGEVRRGTPEQVAEYMRPRLPMGGTP